MEIFPHNIVVHQLRIEPFITTAYVESMIERKIVRTLPSDVGEYLQQTQYRRTATLTLSYLTSRNSYRAMKLVVASTTH